MNDLKEIQVHFKLIGSEMNEEDGYDLYYLSQNMEAFHQLIEKTYLSLKDEKNMSKSKREDLKIKVNNIRPGSFEADFNILITSTIASLLPMVTAVNAKTVWDLAKTSFNYLKTILEANSKGDTLHMEVKDSENVNIINGTGNTIINVHPDVVTVANETFPVFKKIGNLIDTEDNALEKVVFSGINEENPIVIGVKEKLLLQNKNILEDEPVEFIGKIFNADANKYTGKLEVLDSSSLDNIEYNFDFIVKKNIKMKDYYDVNCHFTALKSNSFNPNTLEKTVTKLRIINVEPTS